MKTRRLWYLLFLIPSLPVLLGLGTFIYPRFSNYSDLTISHLPNAVFIANTIRSEGFIPLWSNMLMAGYPFAADPLSGIWYPPGWISILLQAPIGFNLSLALHLIWGGIGMAVFLTRSGLKRPAAIFGGIAFAAMPKIFSHLALGHVSLVYAVAWFPWLLAAEVHRIGYSGNRRIFTLLPGIVLGIIALADVRALAYAGFLYLLFWIWSTFSEKGHRSSSRIIFHKAGTFLGQIGLSLSIAAVQLLPLIQFTLQSTRGDLSAEETLIFSLPLKKVVNLVIPDFGGYAEWIVYPGVLTIFLCILVVATPVLRKRLGFWLAVFGLTLLLSFGSNLPFMNWLGQVPGAGLLRVPPRLMFVAGIAIIVIASHGFNALLSGYQMPKFDPIFSMVAISAFFCIFILAAILMKIEVGENLLWGAAGMILAVVFIGLAERNRLPLILIAILFPIFLFADLIGVNLQSIQYRGAQTVFEEGARTAEFLKQDPDIFRVYSPSYAFPQLAAAQAEIQSVSAINPLQLSDFNQFMSTASGVKGDGYSVAVPPLDEENLVISNIDSQIDAEMLGLLNVKYVIASYSIDHEELKEIWAGVGIRIYENISVKPRAWVEDKNGENIHAVEIVDLAPGKIVIEAEGPGDLIVSEVDYPGWQVEVDRKPEEKLRIANLLMGVQLHSEQNHVEFAFRPAVQYIGLGLSIIAWTAIFIFVFIRRRLWS